MELGFYTAAFPDESLFDLIDWASNNGFSHLEVACWPPGQTDRRYAGVTTLDVTSLDISKARKIQSIFSKKSLSISALSYFPNPLAPDLTYRASVIRHLETVIRAAEMLEVSVVSTFVGKDKDRTVEYNLTEFSRVWPEVVHFAGKHHVKVAIENCPMVFYPEELPGGNNLASTPFLWEKLWEIIPDENFGLNLDPSHLICQMIDHERVVSEYYGRIFHVHAKDSQIDRDLLFKHGILSSPTIWQTPRLPGRGDIDWAMFLSILQSNGYSGAISIEHEDPDFEGSVERVQQGILLARDHLQSINRL